MRKILISLLVVGVVSAVAIGATRAYFTHQETVLGNTIQAGRLEFDLRGQASTTFHLTGLMPGDVYTVPMELDVYNLSSTLSTAPIKYRFYDNPVAESVPGMYDKVNVIVRHTYAGTGNPGSWPIVYQGTLRNMYVDSTSTPGIIASSLGVNITHVFYLEFQLDSSAGNVFQGATATFDIVADGTQTFNLGWTE